MLLLVDGKDTLYFGAANTLWAINSLGGLLWSYPMGVGFSGNPSMDSEGRLYIGGNDSKLHTFK